MRLLKGHMSYMEKYDTISVEVAFAKPDKQVILPLVVPVATTVEQAIEKSGILKQFEEIDLSKNWVGIFSQPCALSTALREGDRVEIYRPLIVDPKESRRRWVNG